jgi:hypothetical protein
MKAVRPGAAGLLLALLAAPAALSAPAAQPPAQTAPAPPEPASEPTPAAAPPVEQPCGARAARYEGGKGFAMVVTRSGQVRTTNPLRPLTPEVNEVLQVVIAGKVATAYGPDFSTLRRGTAPATIEAMLGGPIHWQPALPTLPDPIAIVTEEGATLAQLAFRACEDPPAVKAARLAGAFFLAWGFGAAPKPAEKAPPGFSVPQGAIAE